MYRNQINYAESETSQETSETYFYNSEDFYTALQEKNKIQFKMAESKLTMDALGNNTGAIKKDQTATRGRLEAPEGYKWYPGYEEPVPSSYRSLRPKDVIEWISDFDGSGNVRHFIKEVDEALRHMQDGLDKLCVVRMVLARKISGTAREIINTVEDPKWAILKDILLDYFDLKEQPFSYLKAARDKLIQSPQEKLNEYSRRFVDLHRKIMRAASQRTDPNDARIIQRYEEEESANKFLSGLLPEIHCQLSSKRHINLREAINDALNAEVIALELKQRTRAPDRKPHYHDKNPRTFENNNYNYQRRYDTQPKHQHNERKQLTCTFCKRTGHTEDRCFKKQNFRSDQMSGAPPIRQITNGEDEESVHSRHTYTPRNLIDKSLNSSSEEPFDLFDYS